MEQYVNGGFGFTVAQHSTYDIFTIIRFPKHELNLLSVDPVLDREVVADVPREQHARVKRLL